MKPDIYRLSKTGITGVEKYLGETIEEKCARILEEDEPIKDGAPEIFTDRADGVIPGYNIRTDRWEIAAEAMEVVHRSKVAKRSDIAKVDDGAEGEEPAAESGA